MSKYKPVLATLGYVMSPDFKKVLMIHRNKTETDLHYGKYNGLGGKLDSSEDVVSGLKREIFEEAGIVVTKTVMRGTISWPGFGKNGEDWFGFIFRIDEFVGEPNVENHEGTLEWVDLNSLDSLNLWDSDRLWINRIFDLDAKTFHGIAPYQDGKMLSWSCSEI